MKDCKDFAVNGAGSRADCVTPDFSDSSFWAKVKRFARKAGAKVIYLALKLYYAYRSPETPAWAKTFIVCALVYFISPIDAIPDTVPVIGFTDDLAALTAAAVAIGSIITPEVEEEAGEKLREWFGDLDEAELA